MDEETICLSPIIIDGGDAERERVEAAWRDLEEVAWRVQTHKLSRYALKPFKARLDAAIEDLKASGGTFQLHAADSLEEARQAAKEVQQEFGSRVTVHY